MLTKGQLEVEVISAQKLKFDCDNSFGKYLAGLGKTSSEGRSTNINYCHSSIRSLCQDVSQEQEQNE